MEMIYSEGAFSLNCGFGRQGRTTTTGTGLIKKGTELIKEGTELMSKGTELSMKGTELMGTETEQYGLRLN